MKQRKLDVSEHSRTRLLWENVFAEDTKAFLDYYYFLKSRENEIYVIEEAGEIESMLHLNPYRLQTGQGDFAGHYIVGVATKETKRGRGYMRRLLLWSLEEMYRRKEWFTFLMPAAKEIYLPYDFRYIYAQRQGVLRILEHTKTQKNAIPKESELSGISKTVDYTDATPGDARELAELFSAAFAGNQQVYVVRDEQYYQRQMMEQQSENGGIRLLRAQGRIVGSFWYGREGDLEVLEPLILPEYLPCFPQAVRELAGKGQNEVRVSGGSLPVCNQETPMIMARLLHPECVLAAMQVKGGCTLDCSFAVLDPLLLQNNRIWRISSGPEDEGRVCVRETEDSEGAVTIAALTSILFGMQTVEETAEEEGVIMTPHLRGELAKLEPLSRVFLNEVV